ncbi:DUF7845 domain-containing protein [Haloplanus rubicundus]|uniref:DUF7845 domain-containing protein n=1 Tax=Haloplanus rubicundus TaxID=1547898 RepID=A0A345EHI2_9EURY|nr:hypothetical protein [Haloplanus rubicundus]AXG11654.1 hypothetical protein DU484_18325 [Haloplanus rubicundus]
MSQIEPQTHEADIQFNFVEYGRKPYWILTKLLIQWFDGYAEQIPFSVDGEAWEIEKLRYDKGGIAPAPSDTVGGDALYELRLTISGPGRRSINFHIRPRYEGMVSTSGEEISTPFDHIDASEGVNIHAQGSNVEVDRYLDLLRRAVQALAKETGETVNPRYFRTPHRMSTIQELELYVRIRREIAMQLIEADGPFLRAANLLSDKLGAEGAYFFSNSGPNKDVEGYRHRFMLHREQASEFVTGHRLGKQLKLYHPEKVRDDPEETLYNPKFGVLYSSHKEKLATASVPWHDRDRAYREVHETLLNLLSWSGIETRPDPTTYVDDDAFSVEEAEEPARLVDDPLPQVEAEQESLLMKTLGELTESDEEILQVVADGGEVDVHEAAAETDRSLSTIYRAQDRLGDLLRNENGTLSFISEKIRQDLQRVLDETESALESGVRRLCRLLDVDPRQLEQDGSAWQRWAAKWGAEILEHGAEEDRMLIKIQTMMDRIRATDRPLVDEIVAKALEAWSDSGGPRGDFWNAQVRWTNGRQEHTVSVSSLLQPDGSPRRSTAD